MNTVGRTLFMAFFHPDLTYLWIQLVRYSGVPSPPDLTHLWIQLVRYCGVSSFPPDLTHLWIQLEVRYLWRFFIQTWHIYEYSGYVIRGFLVFHQTWHIYEYSEEYVICGVFSTRPDTFMNTVSTLFWRFKFPSRPDTFLQSVSFSPWIILNFFWHIFNR